MIAKSVGRTAPWMILALMLAGAGVWLAGRVATTAAAGKPPLGPPTAPTKVSDRKTGSLSASFLKGVEKGMTLQQIRDILADYRKAGLDPEDGDEATPAVIAGREKQWYLQLLGDGFQLSSEDREKARKILASLPADGEEWISDPPLDSEAPAWIRKRAAAPLSLFPDLPLAEAIRLFQPVNSKAVAGKDEKIDLRSRKSLGTDIDPEKFPAIPDTLLHSAYVFPLWERQKFPADDQGIEHQIMTLHPAQFETLLLLDGIPDGLEERLDDSGR